MSEESNKDSGEKGIKREKLNWFLRIITLGDRFSLQDFYDRIKKGFVEFLIVFFGVLVPVSYTHLTLPTTPYV